MKAQAVRLLVLMTALCSTSAALASDVLVCEIDQTVGGRSTNLARPNPTPLDQNGYAMLDQKINGYEFTAIASPDELGHNKMRRVMITDLKTGASAVSDNQGTGSSALMAELLSGVTDNGFAASADGLTLLCGINAYPQ